MSETSDKTVKRIDKIIELLKSMGGEGMSVHGFGRALKTDAANIKRAINFHFEKEGKNAVLERYSVGRYSYYRIRGINAKLSRKNDLFLGWGGAPRLGLG